MLVWDCAVRVPRVIEVSPAEEYKSYTGYKISLEDETCEGEIDDILLWLEAITPSVLRTCQASRRIALQY